MAITASIAMSPTSCKALQKATATLTITNTGSTAISLVGVEPIATVNGATPTTVAVQLGRPNTGPGQTTSIAGSSGTLTKTFDVVPMAPNCPTYTTNPFPSTGPGMPSGASNLPPIAEPQTLTYAIGATVYTADGSVTAATTATLIVTPVSY